MAVPIRALAGPLLAAALLITAAGCSLIPGSVPSSAPTSAAAQPSPTADAPSPTDQPDSAPSSAAPGLDPCQLLTKQEAEAAVGRDLQDAQAVDQTCVYTAPPTGSPGQATIFADQSARDFCQTESALNHPEEQIPGIADKAILIVEDGTVCLEKGGKAAALSIIVADSTDASVPQRLRAAATTVAGRM